MTSFVIRNAITNFMPRSKVKRLVAQALLSASLLLALPLGLFAQDEHPAQSIVVASTSELLSIMKKDADRIATDKTYLSEQLNEYVVPYVDFNTMTKLAVGKAWRQADEQQRTDLVTEFKSLLLNTYTNALTEYSGESINFEPFRPERREDRAVVRSSFKRGTGSTIPVLYKLREKDGWLIYDIEVDQISLVTSYRTAFSNEIEKGGIDGLLQTIKDKNAES